MNEPSISLSARLHDSLKWQEEKTLTQELIERGESPFLEIDLGIALGEIDFTDEAVFLSLQIALDQFLSQFQEELIKTKGISLYRGTADFSKVVIWNEDHQTHFEEWISSLSKISVRPPSSLVQEHLFRVFCARLTSEYLHRLASLLPDTIPVWMTLDVGNLPQDASLYHLLSKERFSHLHLDVRGSSIQMKEPISHGICFPADEAYHPDIFESLTALMKRLQKEGIPFRIISEEYLTESWDGLDTIHVIKNSLTTRGDRKLAGFIAAGGEVKISE